MKRMGFGKLYIETTGISITRFNQSTGKNLQKVVSATSDDEVLRNKIESHWYLQLAKGILNFLLNITGLGYSLKGAFIKN